MATEKLIVKNFGPIAEAELDLKKVTVLIGEQASGKSVLAKLAGLFSDFQSIRPYLVLFDEYSIQNFLENTSEISLYRPLYNILYKADQEPNREFNDTGFKNLIDDLELAYSKTFEAKHKNDQIQISSWGTVLDEIFDKIKKTVHEITYIPAERLLISTFSNLHKIPIDLKINRKYIFKFIQDFELASSNLKTNRIEFLKINYENFQGQHKIVLNNLKGFNFSETSTGFQSVVPIVNVIDYQIKNNNKNLFIIDEPELSLYPNTQKELLKYLIENCTKGDNRLIITTHSPYILTALNNLIQAHNVIKKNPEAADEVAKIVPPQYQIDFEDVAAYFVADGTAKSIMNIENQLIDANALDEVSNDISEDFGKLLQLEFQNETL